MAYLFTSESLISFFVLIVLEVVLGIDNVIFVSIIMNRLQKKRRSTKSSSHMDDNRHNITQFAINGSWLVAISKR